MKRIRLSRKKGWRLPEGAVVVARPSRWGNPFWVEKEHPPFSGTYCVVCDTGRLVGCMGLQEAREKAVDRFLSRIAGMTVSAREDYLAPLREATALACWCPLDQPCHADVLIAALAVNRLVETAAKEGSDAHDHSG